MMKRSSLCRFRFAMFVISLCVSTAWLSAILSAYAAPASLSTPASAAFAASNANNLNTVEDVEDEEDIEDAEDAEDIGDAEDAEGTEDAEDIKDAKDAKDVEDVEDAKDTRDTRDTRNGRRKRIGKFTDWVFLRGQASPSVAWKYVYRRRFGWVLHIEMFSPSVPENSDDDEVKRVAESTEDVYVTDGSGATKLSHTLCKLDAWQRLPPWTTFENMAYARVTKEVIISPRDETASRIYRLQAKTYMNMFYGFEKLEKIEGRLGTGEVALSLGADTYNGFHNKALGMLFDFSKATSTRAMFAGCSSLKSLDLEGWDTSKIKDMSEMFRGCYSLISLNLSGWDNSAADVTLDDMFKELWSLRSLRIDRSRLRFPSTSGFDDVGKYVGDTWQEVDAANGGNERNPKGERFPSSGSKTATMVLRDFLSKPDTRVRIQNGGYGHYVMLAGSIGSSGECAWGFVPNGHDKGKTTYTFYIRPMDGMQVGTLGTWDQAHDVPWYSGEYSKYAQNTTKVEIKANEYGRPVRARTCERMFYSFWKLKTADLSGLHTAAVTDMRSMFGSCSELTSITGIEGFQTDRVTSMRGMFSECHKLSSLDIGNWNTSNLKSVGALFYDCYALTSLNLKKWKFPELTNMSFMFKGCTALTTLDASGWEMPKVTDLSSMFEGCTALSSLDAKKWNIPAARNMSSMFSGCTALTTLDASEWNIPAARNTSHMFRGCTALGSLDASGWTFSEVTDASYMFYECKALAKLVGPNTWNLSSVESTNRMFSGCESLSELDLSGWKFTIDVKRKSVDLGYMFENCHKLVSVGDLSEWDMRAVTNMSGMFLECHSLKSLKIGSKEKTYRLMSMDQFVKGCRSLSLLALLGSFSTEYVSTMKNMFQGTFFLRFLSLGPRVKFVHRVVKFVHRGVKFVHRAFNFNSIYEAVAFGDAGASVGNYWKLVIAGIQGGSSERAFSSGVELIKSQNGVSAYGSVQTYKRQTCVRGPAGNCPWKYVSNEGRAPARLFRQRSRPQYDESNKRTTTLRAVSVSQSDTSRQQTASNQSGSWYKENNVWYYGNKEKSVKLRGRHELTGGKDGGKHWFFFDEKTGAQVRGWHKSSGNTWHYYSDEDGRGLVGRHELTGGSAGGKHWFFFDEKTGAQVRGWHKSSGNTWHYYSDEDGTELRGQHELVGGNNGGKNWFYFDEGTGMQIRGWKYIDYQDKWCYYGEQDGAMLKGQHELVGGNNGGKNWFYFDEETGAELRNSWKEFPSQNKWCYYGPDGAMLKGRHVVDGRLCDFDLVTGALL